MDKYLNLEIFDTEGRSYKLIKKLGMGAQGIVYETENGKVVKIIHAKQGVEREELKRRPQLLDSWLDGVTTRSGEPAKPAVISYLGL